MMWNDEITLISKEVVGRDSLKQPITEEKRTTLLCRKRSITRSEFYQASQSGLRPSAVVEVRSFEYTGQELAEFAGLRCRVLKTYPVDREILELTLTEELK